MSSLRLLLLLGTAIPLAACGADDVASPDEGSIVIVTPPGPPGPPAPTPNPTPTPTPTGARFASITPADPSACPAGTVNDGTIDGDQDGITDFRVCQLSGTITGSMTLRYQNNLIYSLAGRVDLGVDVGGDGNAANGEAGTLNIDPGVVATLEVRNILDQNYREFYQAPDGSMIDALSYQRGRSVSFGLSTTF